MKILPLLFTLLFSFSAQAALLMKPGKWRIETLIKRDGTGGQVVNPMAKMNEAMKTMPPEQRKEIEAMTAKMRNKEMPKIGFDKGGMTVCYTKEMLESGLDIRKNQEAQKCRIFNHKISSSLVSMNFRCDNGTTGDTEWKVINETNLTGRTKTVNAQGKKSLMNYKATYLGKDCGQNSRP